MGLISWLFPGVRSKGKKKKKKRGDDVWTYSIRFGQSIDDLDFSSPEDLANEIESLSQIMERSGETDQIVAKKENQDGVVMFAELFNLPLEVEVDELMDGFYGKERLPYDQRLINGIPDDSKIDPYEPAEEVDQEEADRKFKELIYYAQQPKPADEDEPVQKAESRQNADWLLEKNEEETQVGQDGSFEEIPLNATNVEETRQSATNVAKVPQTATNVAKAPQSATNVAVASPNDEKESEIESLRRQVAENEGKELEALRRRVREQNDIIRSLADDQETRQSATNVAETPQSATNVEEAQDQILDPENDVVANVIKSLKAEQSKLAKEIDIDRTAEIREAVKAESAEALQQAQHEAEAEVEQERQERVSSENARHDNAIGQIEADAEKRLTTLKKNLPIELADKAAITLKQRLADEEKAQAQRQKEKEVLEQKINDALALFDN
ncbi:hypothetical protein [Fructobacillus tropaeoli]|uniref:Uncharacterized protein n=1 Tax=Fructobacillus tropaeoli TaxID=709323 RepID=A0A3F3H5A3_9LACO|nr:hypothetical protein [Fructobacillus tropaeoli]GAP04822.1 hypothetical protein FTRO_0090230 [Fructobacillus tropaeoli]